MSNVHNLAQLVFLLCTFSQSVTARLYPRFTNSSVPTSIPTPIPTTTPTSIRITIPTSASEAATTGCDFCIIDAPGGVQLIYWEPDDASTPSNVTYNQNQPYTQVQNGFTFTSPSVYVVYSHLQATETCGGDSQVGPSYAAFTTGYSSSFLAYGTLEIPGPGCTENVIAGGWHTIDFSDLYYNPIIQQTSSKAGCPPWVNPRVSLAADLTDVAPAWASCQPFFIGAFDPPSVLKKESQLAPNPVAGAGPVTDGGPVATALPAQAPAAPTPNVPAPTPGPSNNSPPSNPPANDLPTNNPPAAPPADPTQAPANSPTAPLAEPINALANPAAQSNINLQNLPANPPAAPAANQQNNPSNPTTAPPANTQPNQPPAKPANNPLGNQPAAGPASASPQQAPTTPAAAPPAGPGQPAPSPAQNSQLNQALQPPPNNPPAQINPPSRNSPPAQNNPQPQAAPIGTPQNVANPAPNVPIQQQAVPNSPAQGAGAPPAQAPTQLQAIPNNTPVDGGSPAPQVPTQLQALPMNPPAQVNAVPAKPTQPQASPINAPAVAGNPAPQVPNQPPNVNNPAPNPAQPDNVNALPGGNVNPTAASPVELNIPNAVPGTPAQPQASPQQPESNPAAAAQPAAIPGVALPVNTAPVLLGTTQPLQLGGQPVQAAPDGGLIVGSQSIAQGNHATVAGAVVSVGPSNVAIGGSTYALPPASGTTPVALGRPAPLSIGGQAAQYAPGPSGGVVVGGQTIAQGRQATVSGSVVSVGASNLVVGGSSYALPAPIAAAYLGTPAPPEIGGQPVQQAPSGGVVVAGQTIAQGTQATVQGTVVSAGASNLVVGGSTYALPVPAGATALEVPAPVFVGGQSVQQVPGGGVLIAGQTITQGGATTISGTAVSVGAGNIAIGGSTFALPAVAGSAPVTVGGQAVQPLSNGGVVIAGQTFAQGVSTTISGTAISVGTGNIVVAGSTLALPATIGTPPVSVGGQAVQQAPGGGILIAGQTIAPGVTTIVSGTIVSVGTGNIVFGGSTYVVPASATPLQTPAPLVIGGSPVQQASNGGLIVGSQTLSLGVQTTISGTSVSIGSSAVVINGVTQSFLSKYNYATAAGTLASNEVILTSGVLITEGTQVYTYSGPAVTGFAEGSSEVVIGPGGTATLPLGQSVTGFASEKAALGGLIISALGRNSSFASGTGLAASSASGIPSTPSGNAGVGVQPTGSTLKGNPGTGVASKRVDRSWMHRWYFAIPVYMAAVGML